MESLRKQQLTLSFLLQAKVRSIVIKLLSTAGTGFYYTSRKNPTNAPAKLALKKYDPVVRRHVLFTETKMVCEMNTKLLLSLP